MQIRSQHTADRERDTQRQKVYNAEGAAGAFSSPALPEMTDLARYMMRVINSRRLWKAFPFMGPKTEARRDPITTSDGRGRKSACGGYSQMKFPRGMRTEMIFLHEMAHVLHIREKVVAPRHAATDPTWLQRKGYFAAHGWRFCMIYLQLVRWFLGRAQHDALKREFKARRVRHRPPRLITPEQRLALGNRLRRMRGLPIQLAA